MPTDDTFKNLMNSYIYGGRKISSNNKMISIGRYSYFKDRVDVLVQKERSIGLPRK